MSKNPSRFRGGVNLYVYSWNDPVNFRDRTGRRPTGAGGASNSGEGGGEGQSSNGETGGYGYTPGWCGSGWNEPLVPEGMFGTDWSGACESHDNCYDSCGADKNMCDATLDKEVGTSCSWVLACWACVRRSCRHIWSVSVRRCASGVHVSVVRSLARYRLAVSGIATLWHALLSRILTIPPERQFQAAIILIVWCGLPFLAIASLASYFRTKTLLYSTTAALFALDIAGALAALYPGSSTDSIALVLQPMFALVVVIPAALLFSLAMRRPR